MRHYLLYLILFSLNSVAQDTIVSNIKLDSIKKYHLIYTFVTETRTSTKYQNQSGANKGSTSTRGIFLDFRVGEDGPIKNIGRKGKSLMAVIKNDPEASAELNRSYKVHLRKKRICNILEFAGYGIVLVAAVPLFMGLDDFETEGITPLLVGGGIGVVAGCADVIGFYMLTEKHMNAFSESIQKSISIYNKNLLAKIK